MFGLGADPWEAMYMPRYQMVIALLLLGLVAFIVIVRTAHEARGTDECLDYAKVCHA